MDNNDNENYCYQQPSAKTGSVNKGAIPKANAFKYQNQFNNNNNIAEQENLMPQVNVPQQKSTDTGELIGSNVPESSSLATIAGVSKAESEQSFLSRQREDPYANEDLITKSVNNEEADLDGDSDNNSLGNLSYISDNCLIEEIILLPNNIYSDDENGSASDDCIYAYRGDDNVPAMLEYRDQPADDETDFLEMDFDPEPSSELENLLEQPEIDASLFQPAPLSVERISRQDIVKSPIKSPSFGRDSPSRRQCEPLDEPDGAMVAVTSMAPTEMKKTGAIPKKFSIYSPQSTMDECDFELAGPSKPKMKGNSRNLKLDLKLCTEDTVAIDYRYHFPYYNDSEYIVEEDEDTCCLDCTEKKGLLMQTKQDLSRQKVCRSCHSRNLQHGATGGLFTHSGDFFTDVAQSLNTSNSEADLMSVRAEQIVLQALNKINELKATPPSMGLSKSMEDLCVELEVEQREHEVLDNFEQDLCADNTVTIYTMNCGELTIIEALTRIGVAPNLDILRQYFNERNTVDMSKMSIPQYLLYMSKRDCNFKKLIEAIKSCCDESLEVQYYPLDPFCDAPEVVPINSVEITKRWNVNTNLREIINFKHKHFHTLNVLGKIVNILRQPSWGRHTTQIINIPQYYKSGSITITRIT